MLLLLWNICQFYIYFFSWRTGMSQVTLDVEQSVKMWNLTTLLQLLDETIFCSLKPQRVFVQSQPGFTLKSFHGIFLVFLPLEVVRGDFFQNSFDWCARWYRFECCRDPDTSPGLPSSVNETAVSALTSLESTTSWSLLNDRTLISRYLSIQIPGNIWVSNGNRVFFISGPLFQTLHCPSSLLSSHGSSVGSSSPE